MQGIITVDIGTNSVRALLLDAHARTLHEEHRDNAPRYLCDGRVEQDPASWPAHVLSLLQGCGRAAQSQGVPVAGVALASQRSSLIAVDAAGQALHPAILWQDQRTAALAAALQPHDASVYARTGLRVSPVFSALKMLWLRRERPEVWRATHKLLGIHDWVLWHLCGRHVTDHSLASRTSLLDLRTRHWDPALLALFEVPESLLCELVAPGSVVGGLTPGAAAETGLVAGLPVVSAGGDQQCAALGLGLLSAAQAVCNTGTGSYLIGHAERPVFDPGMRVQCNVSALPGACIVEAAVLASGAVYRWFTDTLLHTEGDAQQAFDALNAQAAAVPPGCNGLLMLPHFEGAGSPHWDPAARGALVQMSLATTRGEVARAVLEAVAIELKNSLDLVEQLCGSVDAVHVSGGLTKSALFNQIQADVFERRVRRPGGDEATSHGAWVAACVALGLHGSHAAACAELLAREAAPQWAPNAALQALYRRQRQRAQAVYHALAAPELRALLSPCGPAA